MGASEDQIPCGLPLVIIMNIIVSLSLILITINISDVSGIKCPADTVNVKQFHKYTTTKKVNGKIRPVADAPCWFDLTRHDCGRCKNKGKQCGTPMQKWCQNPKSKNGCPGIPGNKFTLSTTGFPCYWDHSNKECAWCKTSKMKQCGVSSYTEACGQICAQAKNKNCDGNLFDCTQIPACGKGATCDQKSKQCKCDKDLTGNGQQCFEGDCSTGNCTLLVNVEENIEVSIDSNSQYFVFARGSGEL